MVNEVANQKAEVKLPQAQGGALLAAIMRHLVRTVPGFTEIVTSGFFKKSIEPNGKAYAVSLVFLQPHLSPVEDLDETVLAQIMIFLGEAKQLHLVNEIVVNLAVDNLGSE